MILLNFSHPLTAEQLDQVNKLISQPVTRTINFSVQFNTEQEFIPQLDALLKQLPLSAEDMQAEPILVNPPALNFITALLLAELHGRMGYFPPVIRLRPVAQSLPPRYEVAEILNLQAVRDDARKKRYCDG